MFKMRQMFLLICWALVVYILFPVGGARAVWHKISIFLPKKDDVGQGARSFGIKTEVITKNDQRMKKIVILATILLSTMGFLCAQVTPSGNPDSCQLIQRFDTLMPVQEIDITTIACPTFGNVTAIQQLDGSLLLRTPITDYAPEMVDPTSFQYLIRYPNASWVTETAILSGNELTLTFHPALGVTGNFKFAARMDRAGLCTLMGNVSVYSDTLDFTVVQCPGFDGSIFVSSSSDGLNDTIMVGLSHYDANLVSGLNIIIKTADLSQTIVSGAMQVNSAGTLAVYPVGDWAVDNRLAQYGLTPGDTLAYMATATMVMEEGVPCAAVVQNNITMGVPECPAFNRQGASVNITFTAVDRSIDVVYPVENYLAALLYDGNGDFQMKWYKDGVYQGVIPASYNAGDHSLHATLPKANIAQGRRYDFAPTMKLVRYCNSGGTAFQLVEGDTVGVVFPALCTQYGSTTTAVLTGDSSITLTNTLVYYDADLFEGATAPVFYLYVDGVQKTSRTAEIDSNGQMHAVITAAQLQALNAIFAFEGKTLTFVPRFYMGSYCADPGTGPVSNGICCPYNATPAFVANSTALSLNTSINSVTMTVGVSNYAAERIVSYLFKCCTSHCGQGESGWLDVAASWNGAHNAFSATRSFNYPGDTLKVIPFMVVDHGCAGLDTLYGTLAQVTIPPCPSYGSSTDAVHNPDGTITVNHAIENYLPVLVQNNPSFLMYPQNAPIPITISASVGPDGVITAVVPAATLSPNAGKTVTFVPQFSLTNAVCGDPAGPAPSVVVCVPLPASTVLPSLDSIHFPNPVPVDYSNIPNLAKIYEDGGILLTTEIFNHSNSMILEKGYLVSQSPSDVAQYSAEHAIIGTDSINLIASTMTFRFFTKHLIRLNECGKTFYVRGYMKLNTCDPQYVYSPMVVIPIPAPGVHTTPNIDTTIASGTSANLTVKLGGMMSIALQYASDVVLGWRGIDSVHCTSSVKSKTITVAPTTTTAYTAFLEVYYGNDACIREKDVTVTVNP